MWGFRGPRGELNSTPKWSRHNSPEEVVRQQQVLPSSGRESSPWLSGRSSEAPWAGVRLTLKFSSLTTVQGINLFLASVEPQASYVTSLVCFHLIIKRVITFSLEGYCDHSFM